MIKYGFLLELFEVFLLFFIRFLFFFYFSWFWVIFDKVITFHFSFNLKENVVNPKTIPI